MKLRLLPFFLAFACALGAQTPSNLTLGGVRIDTDCKGTGDPNTVLGNQFPQYECETFKDTVNGKTWKYYPTQTPKWRVTIDSAGSYMNQNALGVVSLGGASKMPVETAVTLEMGVGNDYRTFNLGHFESADKVWPLFSLDPNSNNFGLHINSGNSGAILGSTATTGKRLSMMGVWDEANTGATFNGPFISSSHKQLSTNYGALGTLTMVSNFRPNNQLWRGSFEENSVYGTGVNFTKINSTQIPNYSGFGLANGFTHTVRINKTSTGLAKTPYIYTEMSNHDVVAAGNVSDGRRYVIHDIGYIPTSENDSIGFHMLFGEKTNTYQSHAVANLKVNGTNGRMWAIRQNRINNNTTPLAFDWIRIDPLDGTEIGDKIKFYNGKYALPNAQPSIANLDKNIIVWTGDGTSATPAFEDVVTQNTVLANTFGSVTMFKTDEVIIDGVSTQFWVVPLALNGKKIKDVTFTIANGTGSTDINLRKTIPGVSGTNGTATTLTSFGYSTVLDWGVTVNTGDYIHIRTQNTSGALTGLSCTFNFKL